MMVTLIKINSFDEYLLYAYYITVTDLGYW